MNTSSVPLKYPDLTRLKGRKIACLTLDLEQDYGDLLEKPSYEGLNLSNELINFLKQQNLPLTCFVQGSLLETHPYAVRAFQDISSELELHAYSHPRPEHINHEFEVMRGKEAFVKYFGQEPLAYRSPSGIVSRKLFHLLTKNGIKVDSSIFPSWRPEYFSGLTRPTTPFLLEHGNLVEFPMTVVSPLIRLPISLSYLKLLGIWYMNLLKRQHLPNLIIFDFHLHDLVRLDSADMIPFHRYSFIMQGVFRRTYCGERNGLKVLEVFTSILKGKSYEFLKLEEIYRLLCNPQA